MKITVLLFGIIRDLIGENTLKLDLEKAISIGQLKQNLLKKYNNLQQHSNFSIAVNEEYVDLNYVLQPNDVVALIPPVSGG
ncbi:MAG: MoaD/ThiS family protein [Aureibaculum sp.]|nr:MoaD/ThiS family protein [Aureibaculum sp.]